MPDEPDAEWTRALFHVVDDELFSTEAHIRSIIEMWVDTALAFGLTGLIAVDRTADRLAAGFRPGGIGWDRFELLTEAQAAYRGATWIYLEQGGEPLDTFQHPAGDVIYAFGPDESGGFVTDPGKTYVEIPTVRPIGFFSAQAAAIVLYDRFNRSQRPGDRAG